MKPSLSLTYLEYLERNKSRPSINFNDPREFRDFVPRNSPKIEFGDIGWANRNWEIFVRQYNTNLTYKATYNYMQRYFWSILVNIITYFVDFGNQPSIDRLKDSGIFNQMFLEKFLAEKNMKALDARGIQISQLFWNKGDRIFEYFKDCVEDLVTEAMKAAQIEGDIRDLNPRLNMFVEFARATLKAINEIGFPGIQFGDVDTIINNFDENLEDVYYKIEQFIKEFRIMWINTRLKDDTYKDYVAIFPDINTTGTFNDFLGDLNTKVRQLISEKEELDKYKKLVGPNYDESIKVLGEIATKLGLTAMEEYKGISALPYSEQQYLDAIKTLQDQALGLKDKQKTIYEKLTEITHDKDMPEWTPSSSITDFEPHIRTVITVLGEELVEKQKTIEKLNAEVLRYKTKEFTAQEEAENAKKAKAEKTKQVETELKTINDQKTELQKQLKELEQKLKDNETRMVTLQSSRDSNEAKSAHIQKELDKYKRLYQETVLQVNQKMAERQRKQEELDIANNQIGELKNTNTDQKSRIDELLLKVENLSTQIIELESTITGDEAEIKRLEQKIAALEQEKEDAAKEVENLSKENRDKEQQVNTLTKANEQLKRFIQEHEARIAKCTSDIEALERHNAELQSENDTMRSNNAQLASNLAEAQGQTTILRNENAQLQGQTTTLQSEKAQLASNLAQAQGQVEALQSENMEEKNAYEQLQSELDQAKDYSVEVKAKLDKIVQSLSKNRLKRILGQQDKDMQEEPVRNAIVEENTFKEDDASDLIRMSKRQRKEVSYKKIYDIINLLGELFNLAPFDVKGDPLFDQGSHAQGIRRLFYETFKNIIPELHENAIKYEDITDFYVGGIFNRHWNAGIKLDSDRDNVKWANAYPEWTGEDQMTWLCYRTYVAYAMFSIIKVGHFKPNYISTAMFERIYMIYNDLMDSQGMINISTMSNIMFILYLYISWNKNILRLNDISILVKYYNPKSEQQDLEDIKPFGYFMGDLLAFEKYNNVDAARINVDDSFDDPNIRIMRELNYGSLHNGAIQEQILPDIRLANADPLFLNIILYISEDAQRNVARLDQHDFAIVGAGTIRLDKSRDIVNSLKRCIIKPIIGVNMSDIAIYPVKSLHKDKSMEELTNSVFICMNKRSGNYRVILLNKRGEYAISYPGNSFTNPLMPYDLYLNPQKRNEVIIVDNTDVVPSYFIRLDTRYKDNKVIDNDDLLNSLFPKVEMRNISLRELLEYMIPPQHVIVNGVGSGVITSRDIVNTFITPID